MVGVGHAAIGNGLCLVPAQAILVHQQPHELRNRQPRVGVVDVEHRLVRQQVKIVPKAAHEFLQRILQRGAHQKIVLAQPKGLALIVVVLRVENLGDHLGQVVFLGGGDIVAIGKSAQVQAVLAAGAPGAQGIDAAALKAHHRHVIGHRLHHPGIDEGIGGTAIPDLGGHGAFKADVKDILHVRHFPDVAVLQPVIRQFHLLAAGQFLAEEAILIADGAAHGRQIQRRQRIHKAGGQPPQPAVAQAGLRLLIDDVLPGQAQFRQRLGVVLGAQQAQGVVKQQPAQQKLNGHVVHALAAGLFISLPGVHPALHDLVSEGGGDGVIDLIWCGFLQGLAVVALEFAEYGLFDLVLGIGAVLHRSSLQG